MNDLKMPLNRISMDKSKNKFGNLLLNFCKGNSMFIVNAINDKCNPGQIVPNLVLISTRLDTCYSPKQILFEIDHDKCFNYSGKFIM